MLLSAQRFTHVPVMSLQTGGQLARTESSIVNPYNLTIIAFELSGASLDTVPSYLRTEDVREISNVGIIVDSHDEFVDSEEVIKLKEILELNFTVIDKTVKDERGRKLGKVTSYAVEPGSFMIKQLNVKRPLIKSLTDTELLIDRTQITNVTDDEIIVKNDEREPIAARRAENTFSNPFRQAKPQTEHISRTKPK